MSQVARAIDVGYGNTKFVTLLQQESIQCGMFPSIELFARGEANGFREVLPNMEGNLFWTSSRSASAPSYYASSFNGENGSIDSRYIGERVAIRCVGW